MASSLSNPVDNLTEGIHKVKCKCRSRNKGFSNKNHEELKKGFKNTYKFSNNDINKFILLLRKGVHPYEYIDGCEKFSGTSLLQKEELYSNQNMKKSQMLIACMQKEFVKK